MTLMWPGEKWTIPIAPWISNPIGHIRRRRSLLALRPVLRIWSIGAAERSVVVPDNANDNKDIVAAHDGGEPVIVAIGASAGGVSALQSFFAALPEHPGAAFVLSLIHI